MMCRVLLVAIVTAPILLLWLPMSRSSRMRQSVGLALIGEIVLAAALAHFLPRGLFEISLSCVVLSLLIVVVARLKERRQRDPEPRGRGTVATRLLAVWIVTVLCVGAVIGKPEPFYPAGETILPLPAGLRAADQLIGCGSGSCTRKITVTGRPGQSGEDLQAELTRHSDSRGWTGGCRPVGWLLNRSSECIDVVRNGDQVTIFLSGNRGGLGIQR